jgi:hypothetical protein
MCSCEYINSSTRMKLTKVSVHSGVKHDMTFEAWLKEDKFRTQVYLPFKEYVKETFREHHHLRRTQDHYLLSTADNSASRKAMTRAQEASKVDNDTVPLSSAEASANANHDARSGQSTAGKCREDTRLEDLPFRHSANEDVVNNPTGTSAVEEQKKLAWSWLSDLKSHKRHMPNPEDDDDAEYRAQNDEGLEIGAPDTARTKSTRIDKQYKRAKLTQEDM